MKLNMTGESSLCCRVVSNEFEATHIHTHTQTHMQWMYTHTHSDYSEEQQGELETLRCIYTEEELIELSDNPPTFQITATSEHEDIKCEVLLSLRHHVYCGHSLPSAVQDKYTEHYRTYSLTVGHALMSPFLSIHPSTIHLP